MCAQIPHNDDAERILLATCLYDRGLADEIVDRLNVEDFFCPTHGHVFGTIQGLLDRGLPLEAAAIRSEMLNHTGQDPAGILSQLMDEPMAANVGYYIDILKESHRKRRIIHATEKANKAATNGIESARILGQLQQDIFTIEGDGLHQAGASFGDLVDRAIESVEAAQRGGAVGLRTGFYQLDKYIVGLQPGDLDILCARPGMGKTALALQIAVNAAMAGHPVGFFSMEMTADQLALRAACAAANVEYNRSASGRLSSEEWSLIIEAQGKIHNLPIHIDDTPALHITEIGRRSRRLKRVHGIEMLLADHIQLTRSDNPRDRYLMVTEVSSGLKAIAKELHIPVLALCQLNRQAEQRTDKRPQLSDLRESGAIEQDADMVLGIYRHNYYSPKDAEPNEAQILILKQRNGMTGIIKVGWSGASMRFYNPA